MAKGIWIQAHCRICNRDFGYWGDEKTIPVDYCGRKLCEAQATWDDERWASALRMAQARAHTNRDFNAIDMHAIARHFKGWALPPHVTIQREAA